MADQNENPNKPDSEIRIGVYTCHCGGNIGKVVACEKVAKILEKLDNVAVSRTDLSFCSDAGQQYGSGAAISILLLIFTAVLIIPYLFFSLRKEVRE